MIFNVLERGVGPPPKAQNAVYLCIDHWNDFSFVTMFFVHAFDENGAHHELGNIKIGFVGQTEEVSTYSTFPPQFEALTDSYFSLGNDVDFYQTLGANCSEGFRNAFLTALRDIVYDSNNLERASGESVLKTSLLRDVSMASITGQFKRVLEGGVPVTDFKFLFVRPQEEKFAGLEASFEVVASSKPTTNIHAVIGRNGVGKTTLLNGMIGAITEPEGAPGQFVQPSFLGNRPIASDFFSGLLSISFSAFDPFQPPPEQSDPEKGPRYSYVGLKDIQDDTGTLLKSLSDLQRECIAGLSNCMQNVGKRQRWINAIQTLESDDNFSEMGLMGLADLSGMALSTEATSLLNRMSSGHAIVLLTITKLVEKVEEKTLVLLDEPESHLHPPLLSAFTRALSELLFDRNGVAIIATHSPVVLQEIPAVCVWKLTRSRLAVSLARPSLETFGENVGILTREVFGLEVVKSGYHTVLADAVNTGRSYDDIIAEFGGSLGFEAKAVLRAMIAARDQGAIIQ